MTDDKDGPSIHPRSVDGGRQWSPAILQSFCHLKREFVNSPQVKINGGGLF